jgi:hypothetical protein
MTAKEEPKTLETTTLEAAKQYVDKQIETMKRFGSLQDDLSEAEYKSLVEDIAEAIDLK